jgi:hypothetical protein
MKRRFKPSSLILPSCLLVFWARSGPSSGHEDKGNLDDRVRSFRE